MSIEDVFQKIEEACSYGSNSEKVITQSEKDVLNTFERYGVPINVEFLKNKLKNAKFRTKRAVATTLGILKDKRSIDLLIKLLDDEDFETRARAIHALARMKLEKYPDKIVELLHDHSPDVRRQALYAIGSFDEPNNFKLIFQCLFDSNDSVVDDATSILKDLSIPSGDTDVLFLIFQLWLKKTPYGIKPQLNNWAVKVNLTWKEKLIILIRAIKDSIIDKDNIDTSIIHTISRDPSGEIPANEIAQYIIEIVTTQAYNIRELGVIASLLVVLLGGGKIGQESAIQLTKTKRDEAPDNSSPEFIEKFNTLIRVIAPWAEQGEIIGQLQKGFQTNYIEVAANLTKRTMLEWETTVGQAKSGFVVRLWMNIVMFTVGVILTITGIYLIMANRLTGIEALVGSGISLVTGITTMAATLFFGPLKDIAKSVADVGVLNTSLIGYIHRILQISHTFEYLYLTGKIDLSKLQSVASLVDNATQATAENLYRLIESRTDVTTKNNDKAQEKAG